MGRVSPWMPEDDKVRLAVLGKLIEELGECAAIAARCVIQGIDEAEPVTGKINRDALENELADVAAMIQLTHEELGTLDLFGRRMEKLDDKKRWLSIIRELCAANNQ